MQKLERAVENLIKAVGKIHPVIQTLKQCHPKPPRKTRAKKEVVTESEVVTSAVTPAATTTAAAAEETLAAKTDRIKKIKFVKGSQEAKDFMNMLRQRRQAKK